MAPTTDISDISLSTSAHALQAEKAVKAYRKPESEERVKQELIIWGSLSALWLLGMSVGYWWSWVSSRKKSSGGGNKGESSDDEPDSEKLLMDDLLAMEAGALVGRRMKRGIFWERQQRFAENKSRY